MEGNFSDFFWNFLEDFFDRIFFGGFFWEDFFGGNFLGGFFGRHYLVEINEELMFLLRFWGNFVSMEKEGRKNF